MRVRAGLVLSGAACFGALLAPAARADTYCTIEPCDHAVATLEDALNAASAHPGPDTVLLRPDEYHTVHGLVYSDRGQSGNAIHVLGQLRCEKYGCHWPQISAAPGSDTTPLSFAGGGGARVQVEQIRIYAGNSSALELPPNGLARNVTANTLGAVGVELDGTATRPAYLVGSNVSSTSSPVEDNVAVDVPGYGFVIRSYAGGRTGVRVRGAGFAEIRGGSIDAETAFSGTRGRVVSTYVDRFVFDHDAPPMVGFEVACESAKARDAELTLSSVAILGRNHSDETGVRAVGRGGDGHSCDAVAHVENTVLQDLTTSLEARGEAGSGADPRDGHARIEPAFSAFDFDRTAVSGPGAEIDPAQGQNVDPAPGRGFGSNRIQLLWDSELIDRGNPAPLAEWERPWVTVINGRRDIGPYEYKFATPTAYIGPYPGALVRPGQAVELSSSSGDEDWPDPLSLHWELSDGSTATAADVTRVYDRLGTYRERLTATDPTGRSDTFELTIRVVRQRLSGLTVRPRRLSASAWHARVRYRLRAYDEVLMSVERAVRRRHGRRLRWRRVGSFKDLANPGLRTRAIPLFLGHKRLTPGRYRLVAKAPTIAPVRVGFRIVE